MFGDVATMEKDTAPQHNRSQLPYFRSYANMKIEFKKIPDDKGTINFKVSFEESTIHLKDTLFGVIVQIDGCGIKGEIGGPGLPSQIIRVALPSLTTNYTVSGEPLKKIIMNRKGTFVTPVQFDRVGKTKNYGRASDDNDRQNAEKIKLKLSMNRPHEQPLVEPYSSPTIVLPDPRLYDLAVEQPLPLVKLIRTEQIGMTSIAIIEINPLKLLKNGAIDFYPEIDINIQYQNLNFKYLLEKSETKKHGLFDSPITSRSQAKRAVQLAQMLVVNPEAVFDFSSFFPELNTNIDYLVITDDHAWNKRTISPIRDSGTDREHAVDLSREGIVEAFQRLVVWKQERGLRAKVVTVSDIVNGTYGNFRAKARDLQEVIRNFLKWAYHKWGISWVLLGGDTDIIPVRVITPGPPIQDGRIDLENTDPPSDNKSFWTGGFLKMKLGTGSTAPGIGWPGVSSSMPLIRYHTGLVIPFDNTGSSGHESIGWYFTDTTYENRSTAPTLYIRVNGPESQIKGLMAWVYKHNTVPTDFYYSSIVGSNYDVDGKHDWDFLDNGFYGQYADDKDFDGVSYRADISVGRAPISNVDQANTFVSKVIAYEQFRGPDGILLDTNWPRRMLLVSENWWGGWLRIDPMPIDRFPFTLRIPANRQYYHGGGEPYSLIHLKGMDHDWWKNWNLYAFISDSDVRMIPLPVTTTKYKGRHWHFVKSSSDLSASMGKTWMAGKLWEIPIQTDWIIVYGSDDELSPKYYILDYNGQDFSMQEQEDLRKQLVTEFALINNISRLYQDDLDLSTDEIAAAPLEHLSQDRLRDSLNAGQHFVSLSGHGNLDGCCHLSRYMAKNLTNGYHTFIAYADSCLTNEFDAADAVSEVLVCNPNGGAVAYIGNTRFSLIGPGADFLHAFFHRLPSTQHLGLFNDIRCTLVDGSLNGRPAANRWEIFALNLIGDPEMPVWRGSPGILKVFYSRLLDARKPFTVRIDQQSLSRDIPFEKIAVYIKQDNFSRMTFMDSTGTVSFDIKTAQCGKLDVIVTLDGFIPYIDFVRITGPGWVSGMVTEIIHQSESQQSWVKLQLDKTIENNTERWWNVPHAIENYTVILDAITNANVSDKKISLFVDNLEEGGNIEGFWLGGA